ncbi:MAG: divalent-cation tolerance protein CutA [Desulfobulbaceae bacterium]|nr:divalent-cation tolerance protein CutA [Desulfobulbaceae bacterium]
MSDYIQVETTTATQEQAETIARALLEARLAACVQIVPCQSLYHWQGAIEESRELRCSIKTRRDFFSEVTTLISSLHPYQTPEIVAAAIVDGAPAYMKWLAEELRSGEETQ